MVNVSVWRTGPIVLCLALPALSLAACNSDAPAAGASGATGGSAAGVTEWPASDGPQKVLNVQTWKLTGTVGDGELLGLGATSDSDVQILRVHARIQRDSNGRLVMDVDIPKTWHFDFAPGSLPNVSGDIPADVAMALETSALDAPRDAAPENAAPSSSLLGKSLAPLAAPVAAAGQPAAGGALVQPAGCLLVKTAPLLQGPNNATAYTTSAAAAMQVLQQARACTQADGSLPDPTNAAESANYQACLAAVNAAGCNPTPLYDTAVSEGVEQTPTQPTNTTSVLCRHSGTSIVNGQRVRCISFVTECMTPDACSAAQGNVVDSNACSSPPTSSGCH